MAKPFKKVAALFALAVYPFAGSLAYAENENSPSAPEQAITQACEAQKTYTRKEAFRASTGKIVILYGEGIRDADLIAEILVEDGYPAIAVPGGEKGIIELFVDRGRPAKFNQDDLLGGSLGGAAMFFYEDSVGKPVKELGSVESISASTFASLVTVTPSAQK